MKVMRNHWIFEVGGVFSIVCVALLSAAEKLPDSKLKSGIDRANFDESVKPGDDFFHYVNGNWIRHNPIPAEYSRWGSFSQLHDDNLVHLREIVEGLAKEGGPLDENSRKIRDFYATAMDEAKLEKVGVDPLKDELDRIAKLKGRDELVAEIGHLHAMGIGALFGVHVAQDEKQSTRYIVYLHQGGLSLPEREYYVGTSDYYKQIRGQYVEHNAKMLGMLGHRPDKTAALADQVLTIETKLAEASKSPVQLRDREANYNKYSLDDLAKLTPNLNWDLFWKAAGIGKLDAVIVGQPDFFKRVNALLESLPIDEWRTYLRWHLIHSTAPYLNDAMERENFHFYSETLRGTKQMQPRWKRAISTIDSRMGEALGKLYVEKYFPPEAKRRMDELVKNIMAAYHDRIEGLDWMSAETKKQALAKLATVMPKIGYPHKWRDYSTLEIGTDSYVQNVLRAEAFGWQYNIGHLGKPVDRGEWGMTPPTVNAYYNPSLNEIVFPAGILQPPYFDLKADDAVNYGAIGAVIGHEITHGFDDQGSRSDADGNLRNWWTADDRARFEAKTNKLVAQYDDCKLLGDLHVNGRLTLGENLADLGGVTIAFAAYQRSLGGRPTPVIDGLTGPQRFFMGYAQVWRGAARDAEQRVLLRTDPHSPVQFRTLVPLSNVQAFYDAFNLKPGEKMYRPPDKRVEVW
jgi:putative endopeptidase